ncbi:MAG: VWA domain-containing protein [Verrucomicrobiota bacterium]
MAVELEALPTRSAKSLMSMSRRVLLISIGVHLLFGAGATFWVVSRYAAGRKLTFAAGPKSPNPAERALEHRVQVQQKLQSTNAPPAVPKRVLTTGQAKIQLPPLPSLPVDPASQATVMAAAGQNPGFTGPGATGSAGGTGNGAAINFFGIRDVSSNVVIMIDVSGSMFERTGDAEFRKGLVKHGKEQSFQTVRDEAIKLIEGLTPAVRFDIVRWSGGAHSWKPELVPATDENKQAAIDHIQKVIDYRSAPATGGRPGGTRHDYALEEAFRLKPETIYMLTDGNATAAQQGGGLSPIPPEDIFKVAEAGQKTLPKRAKVHVIYYLNGKEKADERQMLMNLSARNSGQFRRVEAKGRRQ